MRPSPADAVSALAARLRAAGCVYAEDEARLLLEAAIGPDLEALVARRVAGEPLEQVLGWAEFAGLRVGVRPGVFVPRRRTEALAEQAVALLPQQGVLVDLCTGAGAIALAVSATRPDVVVHASDVDPAAVACARANGLPRVYLGDLFEALPPSLRGRVDVLTANVPYVPTDALSELPPEAREHEHRVALDGGADGLSVFARVVAEARDWLAPGGHLLSETSTAQAEPALELLRQAGLAARVHHDPDRFATLVAGTREPASAEDLSMGKF